MKKNVYDKLKEEKKELDNDMEVKALFSQRILAFLLDAVIVFVLTFFISFFIPINDTTQKLYEEENRILEDYVDGTSSMEDYVNQLVDIEYDISKQTVISSIVAIVISLIYYVVYPCYNEGQTLGKKLMKIRIKKLNNEDLSMNDLLIRAMINNSILVNIVLVVLVLFLSKDLYLGSSSMLTLVQYVVLAISLFMVAFTRNGQGLHDKVVHTIVVRSDAVKEDVLCQTGN